MSEWISVNDELPELDGLTSHEVWVADEDGTVFEGTYHQNGCFYPSKKGSGVRPTRKCRELDSSNQPYPKAKYWMEKPQAPDAP